MTTPMLQLVPGDDWLATITITAAGSPVNLTGHTVVDQIIETPSGTINPSVTISNAAGGVLTLTAARGITGALPLGALSNLTITTRSFGGTDTTWFWGVIEGVKSVGDVTAGVGVPGPQGIQGDQAVSTTAAQAAAAAAAVSEANAEADRVAVAADRTAVAADRTAVAADRTAAQAARTGAETAQAAAATSAANAQASALTLATWTALAAITGTTAGQGAEVLDSDAGTHTDPVVGGTVANAGRYSWSASPAGWRRIGATGLAGKADILPATRRIVGPVATGGGGTNVSNTAFYYWPSQRQAVPQILRGIEMDVPGSGAFEITVNSVGAGNALTLISSHIVEMPAGTPSTTLALDIAVPANAIVGIGSLTGGGTMAFRSGTIPNGESIWSTAARAAVDTASTPSTVNGIAVKFVMDGDIAATPDRSTLGRGAIGLSVTRGAAAPIVATGSATGNYTFIHRVPVEDAGVIDQFSIGLSAGSNVTLAAVTMSGTTPTIQRSVTLAMSAGVNNSAPMLEVLPGEFVAVSTANFRFQINAGPGMTGWVAGALLTSGMAGLFLNRAHRMEFNYRLRTGMQAAISRLQTGPDAAGLRLLDAADATGATDATALFGAARAVHPTPYVRQGTFAVTALPLGGDGLHGPGRVLVNGVHFLLPPDPSIRDLLRGARAGLMRHISANDVIAFVGDSKTHWAFASTANDHFVNLLGRHLNIGIAVDEPIMTAFADVTTYTPAFYGVTISGTRVLGSRGPLAQSLLLQAGQTMTFTGAYALLGLWHRQESGAGTLTITRDGTTISTINAAGATEDDRFSGDIATSVTGSATYVITASGAPVEITALARWGVLASNNPVIPRLRVGRFARGSYTFGNFNSTTVASIKKICSAWGGKAVPVIGLGTNDMIGTAPSSIAANAAATIAAFKAATSVDRIMAWVPQRPSQAWLLGSMTGGRTYEPAIAAITAQYRSDGVELIPVAARNYADANLFSEGVHENNGGNIANALAILTHFAAQQY